MFGKIKNFSFFKKIKNALTSKNLQFILLAQFLFSLAVSIIWVTLLEKTQINELSNVFIFRNILILFISLLAGTINDKFLPTNTGKFILIISLLIVFSTVKFNLPLIFLAISMESISLFFDNACESLLPLAVGLKGKLAISNTLLVYTYTTAEILGPILVGIAYFNPILLFTLLILTTLFIWIKLNIKFSSKHIETKINPFFKNFKEGFTFLLKTPDLKKLFIFTIIASFTISNTAFFISYISKTLNFSTAIAIAISNILWLIGSNLIDSSAVHKKTLFLIQKASFLLFIASFVFSISKTKLNNIIFLSYIIIFSSMIYLSIFISTQRIASISFRSRSLAFIETGFQIGSLLGLFIFKYLLLKSINIKIFLCVFNLFIFLSSLML